MHNRVVATAALVVWAFVAHAADGDEWRARLSTVPIDPATAESVTGGGQARAHLDGDLLVVSGTFAGLQGPATEARLHAGPDIGVRGDAIAELDVTHADEGMISGSVTLRPEQIEKLRAGLLYVQLDSETAPEGNLWGWLLR